MAELFLGYCQPNVSLGGHEGRPVPRHVVEAATPHEVANGDPRAVSV